MYTKQLHKKSKKKQVDLLFKAYGKQLFAYGRAQWKLEEDVAWDLVYQSIYKLVNVLPKYAFEDEQKFRSFLFRIYINFLKNRIRDDKAKGRGIQEVELKEGIFTKVEAEEEQSEKMKALSQFLEELEDWKRILLLMRAQEFTYREIAKYTGQQEKNLKVYYGRLKKQLSSQLEKKFNKVESYE